MNFLSDLLGRLTKTNPDGTVCWREEDEIEFWDIQPADDDEEEEEEEVKPASKQASDRLSAPAKSAAPERDKAAQEKAEKVAKAKEEAKKKADAKAKEKADKEAKAKAQAEERAKAKQEAKDKAKAEKEAAKEAAKQKIAAAKSPKEKAHEPVAAKPAQRRPSSSSPTPEQSAEQVKQDSTEAQPAERVFEQVAGEQLPVIAEATRKPPGVASIEKGGHVATPAIHKKSPTQSAPKAAAPAPAPAEPVLGPRARKRLEEEKQKAEAPPKSESAKTSLPLPRPSAKEAREALEKQKQALVEEKKAFFAKQKAAKEVETRPQLPPSERARERPRPKSPSEAKRVLASKRQELLDAKKARFAMRDAIAPRLMQSANAEKAANERARQAETAALRTAQKAAKQQQLAQQKAYWASYGAASAPAFTYASPEPAAARMQKLFREDNYIDRVRVFEGAEGSVRGAEGSGRGGGGRVDRGRDGIPEGPLRSPRNRPDQIYRSLFAFENLGHCPHATSASILASQVRVAAIARSVGANYSTLPPANLSGSSVSPRGSRIGSASYSRVGSASYSRVGSASHLRSFSWASSGFGFDSESMVMSQSLPRLSGRPQSPSYPQKVPLTYFMNVMRDDAEVTMVGGSAVFSTSACGFDGPSTLSTSAVYE